MHPLWVTELQEEILCLCVSHIDLLPDLVQDLFLFRLLLVVPIISLNFILSSLLMVSLSGPRRIILAPDLLFYCMKFLVTRHIWPLNRTYPT
jgi:hypothetical protein